MFHYSLVSKTLFSKIYAKTHCITSIEDWYSAVSLLQHVKNLYQYSLSVVVAGKPHIATVMVSLSTVVLNSRDR